METAGILIYVGIAVHAGLNYGIKHVPFALLMGPFYIASELVNSK